MDRASVYLPKSLLSPRCLLIVTETASAETALHWVKQMCCSIFDQRRLYSKRTASTEKVDLRVANELTARDAHS